MFEISEEYLDLVVDAVCDELVSAANSQLSGNLTRNYGNIGPFRDWVSKNDAQFPHLGDEFPKHRNRELNQQNSEWGVMNREELDYRAELSKDSRSVSNWRKPWLQIIEDAA